MKVIHTLSNDDIMCHTKMIKLIMQTSPLLFTLSCQHWTQKYDRKLKTDWRIHRMYKFKTVPRWERRLWSTVEGKTNSFFFSLSLIIHSAVVLISSFLTCLSKVRDSSIARGHSVPECELTHALPSQFHSVTWLAYRPAAYVRQFISDSNDRLALLYAPRNAVFKAKQTRVLSVERKVLSLWRLSLRRQTFFKIGLMSEFCQMINLFKN